MADEAQLKAGLAYAGATASTTEPEHPGFFGLTIVSCERGDIRQIPEGLRVYGDDRTWDVALPALPDGRDGLLQEAYHAVVHGRPPAHDGRWGRATLEVCLAALESSRMRREVTLHNQLPTPD
jgi:phthalate 4,5-cis-dihydrodiol dehydrogenase